MKKFSLLLFLTCMGVVLYAQKYTEIKGFVKNDRLKEVHLYRLMDFCFARKSRGFTQ